MSAQVILLALLLLALLEYLSRRADLRPLSVSFELDSRLVEPGEQICLRYTIENPSPWPILFIGFTLRLDSVFRVCEDEEWLLRHGGRDFTGTRVERHFYLLPRRQLSGKLRFCVTRRGFFDFGKYYLETGDFLGMKPVILSEKVGLRIICTAESCEVPQLRALGGELGDVSVRRFILDDPSLLIGYREYTGREPMKQISWNQTAKTGSLMVRQNDYTTDQIALVLVNMDGDSRSDLERLLSLVRTVCERLEETKVPYALQSNGDLLSLEEGQGKSQLFLIQRRIGLSQLTGFTRFPALVDSCLRQRRLRCTYIVITAEQNPAFRKAVDRLASLTESEPIVLCAEEGTP